MSGNCLTPRTRRSLFLSTYSLNSNESSIDTPLNTPPLRRHSNSLVGETDNDSFIKFFPIFPLGSKLVTHGLDDDPGTGVRRQRSMSRRRGREPVLRVSNTIAACNYLANTATQSANKKSFINTRQSSRAAAGPARKSWFSRKAKNVVNHTPVPPSIVISEDLNNASENSEVLPGKDERSRRRDSFGTIALKVTEKSIGKERRKSQGDMSHIRAKWLLGFNLTMVI